MARVLQFLHAYRQEGHPVFIEFDFPGHTNDHRAVPDTQLERRLGREFFCESHYGPHRRVAEVDRCLGDPDEVNFAQVESARAQLPRFRTTFS
jgi:hypothetical protein